MVVWPAIWSQSWLTGGTSPWCNVTTVKSAYRMLCHAHDQGRKQEKNPPLTPVMEDGVEKNLYSGYYGFHHGCDGDRDGLSWSPTQDYGRQERWEWPQRWSRPWWGWSRRRHDRDHLTVGAPPIKHGRDPCQMNSSMYFCFAKHVLTQPWA